MSAWPRNLQPLRRMRSGGSGAAGAKSTPLPPPRPRPQRPLLRPDPRRDGPLTRGGPRPAGAAAFEQAAEPQLQGDQIREAFQGEGLAVGRGPEGLADDSGL